MKADNKELVVGLIADHLMFSRIVSGLEDTKIISFSAHPQIGRAVMKLMGISSTLAYMHYLSWVDNSSHRKENLLEDAEDIFNDILWMKKELDKLKNIGG